MKYYIILLSTLLFQFCNKDTILKDNANDGSDALKVGDKAPPLFIAKWIKGSPVLSFQKDKIYIIEFGFAACTPCRASIPHLTRLAKQYDGSVRIISVHIWENNRDNPGDLSYISKVEKFVKPLWDKIAYSVAVDVPSQATADNWGGGAPMAYVVGREGDIVWIGHPDGLDPVIEKLVSNTFNPAATSREEKNSKEQVDAVFRTIWENKRQRRFNDAIASIDSLIARYPDQTWLYYQKYHVLDGADSNNERADTFVKWLLSAKPKGFSMMHYLSSDLIESKHPNYDLAIAMSDWGLEESTYKFSSALILHEKAYAFYKKGELSKAIATQQEALKLLSPDNTEMKQAIKDLTARLSYYQRQ